ncbi:MAG: ABC transporter permease [Clostridia bacterium]|nr:ABC transporter permease [Clostridia bacterium]
MQVFKTYFKIVKKNILHLSIYIFVFLLISILIVNLTEGNTISTDFTSSRTPIAIFNYDEDSEFSNNFVDFLTKYTEVIDIEDEPEAVQDALYFRRVEYVVKIPATFSKDFKDGKNIMIQKTAIPNSTSNMYIDFLIDKYMNSARIYIDNIPGITDGELKNYVEEDVTKEADVTIETFGQKESKGNGIYYYFNFYAYAAFATIILGVTSIIVTFNKTEIKKRNLASPIKLSNYNFQIILGSLIFTIGVWAIICFGGLALYGNEFFSRNVILLLVNSFILSFVVLSISFLIANLVKNKNAIDAISNILTLVLCFLSGVFVQQEYMSAEVLKAASFTPTYWYVKAVDEIKVLTEWSIENILPILNYMLIELIFGVAILAIALVVVKQRRASN